MKTALRARRDPRYRFQPDRAYNVYVWPEGSSVSGLVETRGRDFIMTFRSRGQRGWRGRMRQKLAKYLETTPSAFTFWMRDDLLREKDPS